MAIDEGFLEANGVQPWIELPLWLPSSDPALRGHSRVSVVKGEAAGLHTRPLADTVAAVLDERQPEADNPLRHGKLTTAREAELIARWRAER